MWLIRCKNKYVYLLEWRKMQMYEKRLSGEKVLKEDEARCREVASLYLVVSVTKPAPS